MIARGDFLRGSIAAMAAAGAIPPRALADPPKTALDRYIALPTPEYGFQIVRTVNAGAYRSHTISMISQRWRTASEVDKPLWEHWLTITEPQHIKTDVCVFVISGGSNTDHPRRLVDPVVADVAARTGAVVAVLHMVPNQPLTFSDEGKPRGEDDLVAYTWDKFLRTGDDQWPLRLPMTKAAVRGMDTVTAVMSQLHKSITIDRFIVGGSSKRGWTAWLTAAVDKRVIAIVPVVIDVLNVGAQAQHAYRVYGSWPAALEAYEKMGIMKWLGTPQMNALLSIEDPYSYRERIAVPKLIVNATGDQFFTPDSSQFYFNSLEGEKYLRYVPNTDHALTGSASNAGETGIAFVDSIIAGTDRPQYSWQSDREGTIHVRSAGKPLSVKLWQAVNHHTRDFRLQTIGRAFHATELQDQGNFTYTATVSPPDRGYAAYFVELTYPALRNEVFTVTTSVSVTPAALPFGPPRTRSGAR